MSYLNMHMIKKHKFTVIFISLFLLLLPVAFSINFWHNDDWAYYFSVQNYLQGSFSNHPLTTPTFYSTGLLGAGFSLLFGMENLPILTLFISVASLWLFFKILVRDLNLPQVTAFLLSLAVGVCPLFVFTTWGFLTDNYFLFWFLGTIYFLNGYEKSLEGAGSNNFVHLAAGFLFAVAAYFTRQLGLLIPLGYGLWFVVTGKRKGAVINLLFFAGLAFYHFLIFPKTNLMLESRFVFSNLTYFRYIFSLFWAIGITIVTFLFPFVVNFVISNISKMKKSKIYFFLTGTLIIAVMATLAFNNIGWINQNMYYFKYTVAQKGFFVENLHGKKNHFAGSPLIYKIIEPITWVVFSSLLAVIIFSKNKVKFINQYTILILINFMAMLISPKIYDRYLIMYLPLTILGLYSAKKDIKLKNWPLAVWLIIMGIYSYNFSFDYLKTNNYVYNRAEELIMQENLEPRQVVATDLFRYKYPDTEKPVVYKFTYDDPSKQDYGVNWELVERFEVDFPLSFWRERNVVFVYRAL